MYQFPIPFLDPVQEDGPTPTRYNHPGHPLCQGSCRVVYSGGPPGTRFGLSTTELTAELNAIHAYSDSHEALTELLHLAMLDQDRHIK